MSRIIRTQAELNRAISDLAKLDLKKPKVITVKDFSPDRKESQNKLAFLWFNELGKLTGHGNVYERRRLKLCFGVPVLRNRVDEFERFWMATLDDRPYDIQLEAMDIVPVTRLFTTKEFAGFLTEIDMESADNGCPLPHPEDLYLTALMRDA